MITKYPLRIFEMSFLILAIQQEDISSVKLILDHNAIVYFIDAFKLTLLMYATYKVNMGSVTLLISIELM